MGQKRDADKKKVDAFEIEMREYARKHGITDFKMVKGFKKDLLDTARERGETIEEIIQVFRDHLPTLIRNPGQGKRLSIPFPKRTLH